MAANDSDKPKKGTQLLEVYALEIQMHSEQVRLTQRLGPRFQATGFAASYILNMLKAAL